MESSSVLITTLIFVIPPTIPVIVVWLIHRKIGEAKVIHRKTNDGSDIFILRTKDGFITAEGTLTPNIENAQRFQFHYGTESVELKRAENFARDSGFRIVNIKEAQKIIGSY